MTRPTRGESKNEKLMRGRWARQVEMKAMGGRGRAKGRSKYEKRRMFFLVMPSS